MLALLTSTISCGLVVTALALAQPASAQSAAARDAEFRAAMIYNFARFATWPPNRFADAGAPVVLCVDPSDALLPALARLRGLPVGSRKLHVRTTSAPGTGCHLAFVSSFAASPAQITALNRQGLLTIGDSPGFARAGAIGLVKVGQQTRFEVNTTAAQDAGIAVSSQLMRLAILVRR